MCWRCQLRLAGIGHAQAHLYHHCPQSARDDAQAPLCPLCLGLLQLEQKLLQAAGAEHEQLLGPLLTSRVPACESFVSLDSLAPEGLAAHVRSSGHSLDNLQMAVQVRSRQCVRAQVHKFTSSCVKCRPHRLLQLQARLSGSESSQTGAHKVPNIKLHTCQHVEQQLLHNKRVYSAKLELHACQPLS